MLRANMKLSVLCIFGLVGLVYDRRMYSICHTNSAIVSWRDTEKTRISFSSMRKNLQVFSDHSAPIFKWTPT